jgi:heptosyltransferase-2
MTDVKGYKKILFISFDHIGDILRFTPLLRSLRVNFPQAYLAALLPRPQGEILKYYPYINDVIEFSHQALRAQLDDGVNIAELVYKHVFSIITMLREAKFDLVINPFMDFGAVITGLVRPANVLGRVMTSWGKYEVRGENAAKFYYLMAKQNQLRVLSDMRFSDAALTILKDIGIDKEEHLWRTPELFLSAQERTFADSFFKEHCITSDHYVIGFQVGAMLNKARLWPAEKFAQLANKFRNEDAVKIILLGTAQERKMIERDIVPSLEKRCILAAGETDLLECGALIEKLDLLVSNDTGPMHMAAGLGIPVVALFGRATSVVKEAWPNGDTHTVIVENNTKDIAVDTVFNAVKNYMNNKKYKEVRA